MNQSLFKPLRVLGRKNVREWQKIRKVVRCRLRERFLIPKYLQPRPYSKDQYSHDDLIINNHTSKRMM